MNASISGQKCMCSSKSAALNSLTSRVRSLRFSGAGRPRVTPAVTASAVKYTYKKPPSIEGVLGDKYAVIEVGGLQQIVEEGHWYSCNRLNVPPGSIVNFPRVLAVKRNGELELGKPYLKDATVQAEILEDFRGPKVIVAKFKRKKHYKRRNGHRQELTRFRITSISEGGDES